MSPCARTSATNPFSLQTAKFCCRPRETGHHDISTRVTANITESIMPNGRRSGVPSDEQPRLFRPDGSYPPNDLSWYGNIPVPTSYMIVGSHGDFLGGYDHPARAGMVHVANHHISPGKKQWTWGNHEFGYAWERNLTESDGPYVELMGWRVHRQSAGFFISRSLGDEGVQPVLVPDSRHRHPDGRELKGRSQP